MFQILIVDDEHILLNGCSFMIQNTLCLPFSVSIKTALNVPEAISILEEETPDLILTDIRMPIMDGFSLIQYIRKKDIPSAVVILTSHADFEYARTALRYNVTDFLLKPIDENALKDILMKVYEMQAQKRQEENRAYYLKLLQMLLYEVSASDLLLSDDILSSLFPHTYFTVLVVEPEALPDRTENCEALLLQYYQRCHCYSLKERGQLVFICNHDAFFVKPANLPEKFYQAIGSTLLLGTSISSNSIHNLHSLYSNACQRIFYQKMFGNNTDLTATACFSYQDCIRIFFETEGEKLREELLRYIRRLQLVDQPSAAYLSQVYTNFFLNISLYLENMGASKQDSDLKEPSLPPQISTFEELADYMQSRILQIKERLKESFPEKSNDLLAQQLLAFIKSHYQEDISLDDLAEAVGFHPNYICTFFKKAIGQSYLSCLHQERIAVAKELLSRTSQTVEEISHHVGYNSSTQFARIFRKYEGVSPSDYRNQ